MQKKSGIIKSGGEWGKDKWDEIPFFAKDKLYWLNLSPNRTNNSIEKMIKDYAGQDLIVGKNTSDIRWAKIDDMGIELDPDMNKEIIKRFQQEQPNIYNIIQAAKKINIEDLTTKYRTIKDELDKIQDKIFGSNNYHDLGSVVSYGSYGDCLKMANKYKNYLIECKKQNKTPDIHEWRRLNLAYYNTKSYTFKLSLKKFDEMTDIEFDNEMKKLMEQDEQLKNGAKKLGVEEATGYDAITKLNEIKENISDKLHDIRMAEYEYNYFKENLLNDYRYFAKYYDNSHRASAQSTPILKSTGKMASAPADQFYYYKLIKIPGLRKYNAFTENFRRNFLPEYSIEDFKHHYVPYNNDYIYINYDALKNLRQSLIGTSTLGTIGIINNSTNKKLNNK